MGTYTLARRLTNLRGEMLHRIRGCDGTGYCGPISPNGYAGAGVRHTLLTLNSIPPDKPLVDTDQNQ